MSVIYRPHRGSLVAAMEEAKEFSNLQEMLQYVTDSWNDYYKSIGSPFEMDISELSLGNIHEDERIGWKDAMMVLSERIGEHRYSTAQCIGYCATDYKEATE